MRIWPATQSISFYAMKSSGGPRDKPSRISFVFLISTRTAPRGMEGRIHQSCVKRLLVEYTHTRVCGSQVDLPCTDRWRKSDVECGVSTVRSTECEVILSVSLLTNETKSTVGW
jgi:CRISPR/Cas system-associated protein Csm6